MSTEEELANAVRCSAVMEGDEQVESESKVLRISVELRKYSFREF